MSFERLAIPEVVVVIPEVYQDDRGLFMELRKVSSYREAGIPDEFVQTNVSWSKKGVMRGIHYQVAPHAQGKLVRAVQGEIYDVAVDLRRESPTYLKWCGVELTETNHKLIYVPPGFGHAFCVLGEGDAQVSYEMTHEFAPESERGLRWNDPAIGIDWPVKEPIVSAKDQSWPLLEVASR
jgi:dTDP-4-dehydrorhamnose 3,5-epimerase